MPALPQQKRFSNKFIHWISFGENGLYICWFKIRVWCMLKGRKTSSAASVGIFCWFVILIRTHIICHHFEFYLMQLHVPFILVGHFFSFVWFFPLSLSLRCRSILSPFSICLLLMFSPYALGSQYSLYFIIMWIFFVLVSLSFERETTSCRTLLNPKSIQFSITKLNINET